MNEITTAPAPEAKTETTVVVAAEPAAKAEAPALPTRAELLEKGWTERDVEAGEKHGMVAKEGAGAARVKKDEAAPKPAAEAKPPEKKPSAALAFDELSSEKEKVFLDTFGPGSQPRALYFRMKNERHARQSAEARIRELELENKTLKTPAPEKKVLLDAKGRPVDPEEQPLTPKSLREIQEREAEELRRQREEQATRTRTLKTAQTEQEEYVRAQHPDFDATMELAKEVLKNIDDFFPEKAEKTRVLRLVHELQVTAASAEKIELDDRHAALVAYELGRLHPKYGKTAPAAETTGSTKDPKANGGLSAEAMKRIEANTQRRASGASVQTGGGKRTISVEDVDANTLNGMTYKEREAFRAKHPDRYTQILRG